MYEIYKNNGSHHPCASFWDVLLANESGKHICKYLRHRLAPRARNLIHCTQFGGGFNEGETCFAHLYIKCAMKACKASLTSGGVLILDVVIASAKMLRTFTFNIEEGDESWIGMLLASGSSHAAASASQQTVSTLANRNLDSRGQTIGDHDGFCRLHVMLVPHWYVGIWMSQECLPGIFEMKLGSMAGTPLANLLFTVAISRVRFVLRKSLAQDDLEFHVMLNGSQCSLRGVSFVHDSALPISGSAGSILDKVVAIATVADGVFNS